MKSTHLVVIALIIVFISTAVYSTEYVKGDLKPRSYFFKKIHATEDKPRIVIATSADTTIYGFTPEEYAKYKSKTPYATISELTRFGTQYFSEAVPAKYSELIIVIENRDFKNELHFSINIMKSSDAATAKSLVYDSDEAVTSDADISLRSSNSDSEDNTKDNHLTTSINSPYLPHLTNAHMYQLALCAFASRFHFTFCHHVVKNTLSGEGYEAIPHASFSQNGDSFSSAVALAADGTTPDSTTTKNGQTTTTTVPTNEHGNIIVNITSGDTMIFVILLIIVVLMWAALLAIIIKLGRDGNLKSDVLVPTYPQTSSYQPVSSVN